MKKRIAQLFFLLFIATNLSAQVYTLSGIVKDSQQKAIPYANIALINMDSNIQNGVISGENGTFSIENIERGNYKIIVSFVGYKPYEHIINIDKSLQFPTIILDEDAEMLQTVEIIGYKKLISMDRGKTTLKVEGTMLTSMPSSTMLISFVPGVKVLNDKIEVIGKGVPLIFINGKEVRNQSQITNLQPEMIKSITVDRNPSAKYDARYNSVMHITTKQKKAKDVAIQLVHSSALNRNYNHSETVYINQSSGKFTNYISYKFKNMKNDEVVTSFNNILLNDNKQDNTYYARMKDDNNGHSLTLSSNIKLNAKNTIDIQYLYDDNKQKGDITGRELQVGRINKRYDVNRYGDSKDNKHNLNLNYSLHIDSLSTFDIYGDYAHIQSDNFEVVRNQSTNMQNNYNLDNQSNFNTYAFRAEYNKIFSNGLTLGLGTRYSEIKSNVHTLIKNTNQSDIENHSTRKEQTFASYVTLSKQFSKIYAEFGVRVENNKAFYTKNGLNIFSKSIKSTNILPSLSLNYKASAEVQINLNYTNKIVRPSFSDLDPSISYLSSYLYDQGNPNLNPTINHNISLGTTIKDNLNLSVAYDIGRNMILHRAELAPQNNNLLIHKPINLEQVSSLNFNASYALNFGKFQSNIAGVFSYSLAEYPFMGSNKINTKPMFELTASGVYLFSTRAFIFGAFQTKNRYTYINTEFTPTYNLMLGATFKLLKDKLEMTLFGNNLLNKGYSDAISEYGYVSSGQNVNPDKRMVGVTLKFNINGFKNIFKSSTSSHEDLKRIEQ